MTTVNIGSCPECYDNEHILWRDQPMNPEIKKVLTYSRYANMYYHTLDDAMSAWGTQIEDAECTELN